MKKDFSMSRPLKVLRRRPHALPVDVWPRTVAQAQEPWRAYEGLEAIEIPFANGPDLPAPCAGDLAGLNGARPRWFGMDTGSTGIVVSAEHFIPGPRDVSQGPGRLVYNSSGRVLSGEHWLTDVVIHRNEHTPVATARVQVLRVSQITCLEHARDCRPESEPRNVGFMGVGFDRGAAQATADNTSPKNPFVSLVSLASGRPVSSVRQGYVITRTGVHLGMTPEPHPPHGLREADAQGASARRAGLERRAHDRLGRRRVRPAARC